MADLRDAVQAFLEVGFGDPKKPYRTQREMREDAMRVVGFSQAQETLRALLAQCDEAELAETRTDGQLKPMKQAGMNLWVPPEWPVRGRRS